MSLLTGSSMILFGGGACIIPFLNLFGPAQKVSIASPAQEKVTTSSETTSSGVTPNKETQSQRRTPLETIQVRELDNCEFKSVAEKVSIPEWEKVSPNYFSFACNNSGQHENFITSKWTIWIPKSLLKEEVKALKDGQRINIKTSTSFAEEESDSSLYLRNHITVFESKSFLNTPILGKWGDNIAGDDYSDYESFIYTVTITKPQLENTVIYLRLN